MTLQSQEFRRFEQTNSHAEASPHKQAPMLRTDSSASDEITKQIREWRLRGNKIDKRKMGESSSDAAQKQPYYPTDDITKKRVSNVAVGKTAKAVISIEVGTGIKRTYSSIREAARKTEGSEESVIRRRLGTKNPYLGKMWCLYEI